MKEFLRKNWKIFLAIAVSVFYADRLRDWLGWPDNFISYTGVYMSIFFLTIILITIVELIIKKIRK